jgi:hypothetical protein
MRSGEAAHMPYGARPSQAVETAGNAWKNAALDRRRRGPRLQYGAHATSPVVAKVTRTSNALDLDSGVPDAQSARDRAVAGAFRRGEQAPQVAPFRSAMSMLTFYVNRAGKKLPRAIARR